MIKYKIGKKLGRSPSNIEAARNYIGQLVYYSDKVRTLKKNIGILVDVDPNHKYPYQIQNIIGRWYHIATVERSKYLQTTAAQRLRRYRAKEKERGIRGYTFRITDEVLETIKSKCEDNIPVRDALIHIFSA